MGDLCFVASENLPLWYAHYDGQPSFGDFNPLGGWQTPTMKQYGDSVGYCGINADADYQPSAEGNARGSFCPSEFD